MPLLQRKPIVVQRVYYKPSTMDRLRSLFAGRHHAHPYAYSQPAAGGPVPPRKTYARRPPVRRGVFGRRHHRHVRTAYRPSTWTRLKYSLKRPRGPVAVPAAGGAATPRQPRRVKRQRRTVPRSQDHYNKGRVAALLALLTLQKHRHGQPHYQHQHRHLFRRHHRMAHPVGAHGYVY